MPDPASVAVAVTAQVALSAGFTWQHTEFADRTSHLPGPGLHLDIIRPAEGFAFGAHLGWTSGWNRAVFSVQTPTDYRSFDSLFEVHALAQWRRGRVAVGAGLGIDVLAQRAHYADAEFPEEAETFGDHDTALGGHVQLTVDLVTTKPGTIAFYGGAGLLHILSFADFCGGECSAPRQGPTVWAGVAFRFNR